MGLGFGVLGLGSRMDGKVWGCIGIHSTLGIRSGPEGLAKCMAVYGLGLFGCVGYLCMRVYVYASYGLNSLTGDV